MRRFILRRESKESEDDRFEYLVSCCKGVNLTTPFKEKATVYDEFSDVFVVGENWNFVELRNVPEFICCQDKKNQKG